MSSKIQGATVRVNVKETNEKGGKREKEGS